MFYSMLEMQRAALVPWRMANAAGQLALRHPLNPIAYTPFARNLAAAGDVFEAVTRRYGKPDWKISKTTINAVDVPVSIETVRAAPWVNMLHFKRDPQAMKLARPEGWVEPRVLIVAPLSGHYATLLRGTVETFLPDHEVFITDWADAAQVPISAGRFDFHDYIDEIRAMLSELGGGAHVVAVCQPGPPVLAAIALMAEDKDPALPASMTFMGSPIDARQSPTVTNKLAEERPFSFFETKMIQTVPLPHPGAFRRVYPGFVQLYSFMSMNRDRHVDAHWSFFNHLVDGDGDEVQKHREFYDEYLSVLDLSEEFYLETIQKVFQEYHLATGKLVHRGRLVRTEAIETVALMTVEGENDDISGIGQTQAAHDLCVNIPDSMKIDYVQPGVGHYGVFNGRRFKSEIYPRQKQFIRTAFDPADERASRLQSGIKTLHS